MADPLPYALIFVGLIGVLLVLLVEPLPIGMANLLVGGSLIALAAGSITHLIAQHSGPDDRRPDF